MKEMMKARAIQIPEWMNAAISGLAAEHSRNMEDEIKFLVKAALEYDAKAKQGQSATALLRAGPVMGEKT
jgi:plasmid stability protein